MSPGDIAAKDPQRTAYIVAETGQIITYAELEADANQGAQLFRSLGLQRGDHIALLLENHPDFSKSVGRRRELGCILPPSAGGSSRLRWNTLLITARRGFLSRQASAER